MVLPPARDLLASSRISAGGAEPPGRSAIGGGERVTLTAGARPRPWPAPPPARAGGSAASLWLAPRPRAESARQSIPSAAAGRLAAASGARRPGEAAVSAGVA